MENTSNALIIAGEVLIGILVLSLAAYMFIQFGTFSSEMHDAMTDTQITEFNSNFTIYSDRANITAQEIATAINFAKQSNNERELVWNDNSPFYTTVYIDGENVFNSNKYIANKTEYDDNEYLQELINNFIKKNNIIFFSCNATMDKNRNISLNTLDIHYEKETGQINRIDFHSISPSIITIPESFAKIYKYKLSTIL